MKHQGDETFNFESNNGRATIRRWGDRAKFIESHSDFWLDKEAENTAFLSLGAKSVIDDVSYYSVHNQSDEVQQTACLNPNDQIIISNGPEWSTRGLCTFLADNRLEVPGIFAPAPTGDLAARLLEELTGKHYRLVKELLHLELRQQPMNRFVEGSFRLAGSQDFEQLVSHRTALQAESNTQRPFDSALSIGNDLRSKTLYCWVDATGKIVASGSLYHDRTPKSSYINHVYVPIQHRRQGYAFALVHKLCELALEQKKIPSLSVDATNQPAYRLYLLMGFTLAARMGNFRR